MDAYKQFVCKHSAWLSTIEALTQGLTWLIPNRSDEVYLEAAASTLGVVSVVNESILTDHHNRPENQPSGSAPQAPRLPWPLYIALLQQVEVFLEMLAMRLATGANTEAAGGSLGGGETMTRGVGVERNTYPIIALVEALKAGLRAVLLLQTRAAMLLEGGATTHAVGSRWRAGVIAPSSASCSSASSSLPPLLRVLEALSEFRVRRGLQPLPSITRQPALFKCYRHWSGSHTPPPFTGVVENISTNVDLNIALAEVLHIMRPVAYSLMLWKHGRQSWKPWLLAMFFDLTSGALHRQLVSLPLSNFIRSSNADSLNSGSLQSSPDSDEQIGQGVDTQCPVVPFELSKQERAELSRRRIMLGVYLFRSPMFEKVTLPALTRVSGSLKPVPGIGSLSGTLLEMLQGIQAYHFYTSNS